MDVPMEIVFRAQQFYCADKLLHCIIRRLLYGGREKQTFNIVALIKVDGKFADFLGRCAGARHLAAAAAPAVFAVKYTDVAHEKFE